MKKPLLEWTREPGMKSSIAKCGDRVLVCTFRADHGMWESTLDSYHSELESAQLEHERVAKKNALEVVELLTRKKKDS